VRCGGGGAFTSTDVADDIQNPPLEKN